MRDELGVVQDARMIASRRVFHVSDETMVEVAQALLDLVDAYGEPAQQLLAKRQLARRAKKETSP